MKILVLSKRLYTGKDLINDRYGRLFEIPSELSKVGHEVKGVALSYRLIEQGVFEWSEYPNMEWHSINAIPSGLVRYYKKLDRLTDNWKPDIVWASSDVLHICLAYQWTKKNLVPLVIDLYDNYESFGMAKLPLLTSKFREACKNSAGLTAVTQTLIDKVERDSGRKKSSRLINNAARTDIFFKKDKIQCRKMLNLPLNANIIGTAGAITEHRGINDLFRAFEHLSQQDPNLWLVVAGPKDRVSMNFKHPRFIDLGTLDLKGVSLLLSSLDVGIICNKDSSFGRYCFPLKLAEFLASQTPFVAADVGEVSVLLSARRDCLYEPGSAIQLARKISKHLGHFDGKNLPPSLSWKNVANEISKYFHQTNDNTSYQTSSHLNKPNINLK
ncbi:glycosyltransferase family 4 protein [Marinobacter sp. CA1]|uniref:glycosyltransferase family 4 protein n=1 Tax=Marinobacter sp. CA1 TaxID=2817656 RepID=UPI001D090AD8|nr:glycosyltransferase family 4 protein [Marinobacter sp. CA1]UDL03848.1 glycosyltransferase family 4 protein [Marinobacter sp. CA1]